ncbi:MAG TPA: hypothetical protein VN541_05115, partial [Tepidisphaeraceae bacterium]|nr:hypothetical protein [Tepidisphaeraceae bacterium]
GMTDDIAAEASGKPADALLGRWVLVRAGRNGNGDGTEFLLKPDGRLDYISTANGQYRIMHLAYRVEGSYIVSMQLPVSKEVRTRFQFDESGNLILELNGQKAIFRRARETSYES